MNDGYGDADEASFTATTTTPDFLGFFSDRDEKMDAYHERIQKKTREVKEAECERR